MPFHNAFMIRLFETGDYCAGLNTAVNSNVPGDLILGDDSGVVVIPYEKAEEVLKLAKNIESVEQEIIADVKNGSSLKEARAKHGYHHLQSKEDESL